MRLSKILLVDAIINLILGVLLATFPTSVVEFLGVPNTDATFYPSLLGAVLIGMGVALVIEYIRKLTGPSGLGLYGAIAINLGKPACELRGERLHFFDGAATLGRVLADENAGDRTEDQMRFDGRVTYSRNSLRACWRSSSFSRSQVT